MTTPELLALLREVRSNYGRLHDFVSDCIENGRLTEDMLPDDYKAIADQLEACVGTDHRLGLALHQLAPQTAEGETPMNDTIPTPAPVTEHELDEHELDRLLHAAFIMEGVRDLPGYNAMLDKWDQGCIELVDQLLRYVPVIAAGKHAAVAAGADYAGVFDYEVSNPFGLWCVQRVAASGELPTRDEALGFLQSAINDFFTREHPSHLVSSAVAKAVQAYAQGAQP